MNLLTDFYDQDQCCYCSWIGQFWYNDHEIEWSVCKNKLDYNHNDVCFYPNKNQTVCQTKTIAIESDAWVDKSVYSVTSSLFLYRFPKYYPYYGITAILFTFVYILLMVIPTWRCKRLLSTELFVGNITVSMVCFYAYIKAYQYSKTSYSHTCPDAPWIDNHHCYEDAVNYILVDILRYTVWTLTGCALTPLLFCCFQCLSRKCSRCYGCNSCLERAILVICSLVGILFFIVSIIVNIQLIRKRSTHDFQLIPGIASWVEKAFLIIVTIILFVCSWTVFALPHCCKRLELCRKARNRTDYILMMGNDEEQADNVQ